jgi:prophage regulatory protein
MNDILARLSLDPGQRTLGQLIQDREAAAHEIRRLRNDVECASAKARPAQPCSDDHHAAKSVYPPNALMRLAEVCKLFGVSRSTVYKWMTEGSFPRPVHISERAVRWRWEDVEA